MNCNKTYLVGCIWLLLIRTGTTAQHAGTTAQNEWNTHFGSESVAESWLNQYHALLGGVPIVVAESSAGFVEVQKVLSAISHGGVV